MQGYLGHPEDTAAVLVDGWLHTGDIGELDPRGYLRVLDRRDDLIVSGGENVYPAEVEAVLLEHPAVLEAAVIGRPDRTWGQAVHAVVVPVPGTRCDAEQLATWVRERLAGFKLPRSFEFASELPRTASGKLRRGALRGEHGGSSGAGVG
jgi:acyl-CoA synthetase (AMP-forming)/AMP-acid ligase II